MEELKKEIEEAKKRLEKKVDVIQEKTGKKINFDIDFVNPFIEINGKKINCKMPVEIQCLICGMYEIAKDL